MTLGFHRAGFRPLAGVELDRHAARSHALNFHSDLRTSDPARFEKLAAPRDITQTDPERLLAELGYDEDVSVDVIVGGPPCPAFTRIGRAKLREVRKHPEAFKHDPRWRLYLPYLEYVRILGPLALVMENVPDLMNFGGHNLAEDIADDLEEMGYHVAYTLLNAVHFGVPQMRDRFFLVALDKRLGVTPCFPEPTNFIELPRGYISSRQVAMKRVTAHTSEGQEDCLRFVEPPCPPAAAPPAVTVGDALGDLPARTPAPRGPRRLDRVVKYLSDVSPTPYVAAMRTWPGFATNDGVTAHVTRASSERDRRIFAEMKPGDDYPAAHALAVQLFEAALKRHAGKQTGDGGTPSMAAYVPPYDSKKFPNKWRKMHPRKPARTLMAHLGKDSYTHIHYDDAQRRVLTVREAARLQSFPDGFQFSGSMNPGFRQIGNAVPPLLAYAIAQNLRTVIEAAQERSEVGDDPQDNSTPISR